MKKALLWLVLLAAPRTLLAQAEAVLSATRVREFVLLVGRPDRIDFAVDPPNPTSAVMRNVGAGRLFSVTQGRSVNVVLSFLNPVDWTWSISSREAADPVVASVDRMLSLAAGFPGLLTTAAGSGAESAPTKGVQVMEMPLLSPPPSTSEASGQAFSDPSLIEWGLWTELHSVCIAPPALQSAREQAALVDAMLYFEGSTKDDASVSTASAFRTTAAGVIASLRGAADLKGLLDSLAAVDKALASLEKSNQVTGAHLTAMGVHGKTLEGASTVDSSALCTAVRVYSRRVFEGFAVRGSSVVLKRTGLVAEMRAVVKEIRDRVGTVKAEDIGFVIGEVAPASGKRVLATVTVSRRDVVVRADHVSSEAGKSVSTTFEVMEHQSLVTELSPGVAYSPVAFPRFATNDTGGGHVIVDAGEYRPNTIVMEMLNLIPNAGWSGFTRLMGQLGLGITKEAAVVLVGGGIRFTQPARFVLSFGALFPFVQELKEGVRVGDAIAGEAALEEKVQRVLGRRPSFYIGIQR